MSNNYTPNQPSKGDTVKPLTAEELERARKWLNGFAGPNAETLHRLLSIARSSLAGEVPAGRFVAGPVWLNTEIGEDGGPIWTSEVQTVGGHGVIATVHGASEQEACQRRDAILAALSSAPDALSTRAERADGLQCTVIEMGHGMVDVGPIYLEDRKGLLLSPRGHHIPLGEPGSLQKGMKVTDEMVTAFLNEPADHEAACQDWGEQQRADVRKKLLAALSSAPDALSEGEELTGPVDGDTPLQAAAREAGWALSHLVDGAPWERRTQVAGIIERLAMALKVSESTPATGPGQELVERVEAALAKIESNAGEALEAARDCDERSKSPVADPSYGYTRNAMAAKHDWLMDAVRTVRAALANTEGAGR